MGDYWNRKNFLVNTVSHSQVKQSHFTHAELASILQCKPAIVKRSLAELRERGLLAPSPARQTAQVAIACRCGEPEENDIARGVSFLTALSIRNFPGKLHSSNDLLYGRKSLNLNLCPQKSYEGFKTPIPLFKDLPEKHSFVDFFERLLLSAKSTPGRKSMLACHRVELGRVVITHVVQVEFNYDHAYREFIQYALPGEMEITREDFAQFTTNTILRLAKLVDKPLV